MSVEPCRPGQTATLLCPLAARSRCGIWNQPSELPLAGVLIAGARPPGSLDLSQHLWVHDQVPERLDRGHVAGPEQSVWLNQDRHLAPLAAGLVRNPPEMQDAMHG